jgi:serine/threonine protein kinase
MISLSFFSPWSLVFILSDSGTAVRGCRRRLPDLNLQVMTSSAPGRIVLPDRFTIDREIGRGGMAVVYSAHDHHLSREVAIKVMAEELSSVVGVERFQREIDVMAKLVHPGIVALFDSGEADGRLYYVMPLVSGETLRERLIRQRRMTMEDTAAWGADIADALAYAHGLGIVHRDVKPENIFTIGGRAVLSDFGIARVVHDVASPAASLTTAGMVIGTMTYMSPEQVSGEAEIDGQSDLYSLGCVLYELLAGVPPFVARTPLGVLAKHLSETPRSLKEHNVRMSPEMEAIVMQLLAKNPKDRPSGAVEVSRALRSAATAGQSARSVDKKAAEPSASPTPADELVNKGMQAWRRGIPGGAGAELTLQESRAYFERALAIEPRNARALSGMANYYGVMATRGYLDRETSFIKAREFVFSALAADDKCTEAHTFLGLTALYVDDDFHAAVRHFRRALELDPYEPDSLRFQSVVLKILGRLDEAVTTAREATARAPDAASVWNGLGDTLIAAGRNAEAVDALKRAISLKPGYGPALERLELALFRIGEADRALETRVSRLRVAGYGERAKILEREAAEVGFAEARLRDVRRELDQLLAEAEKSDPFIEHITSRTPADCIVIAYAELGEWTKAMDWVERAYERRPGRLRRMLTDHPYDHHGLAVDPRYARLLRVAGLEELL